FFGDEVDAISRFDPLTGHVRDALGMITFFPAKQFVTPADKLNRALTSIRNELEHRIVDLESQSKRLEAQRLRMRTEYDLEMLQEMGFCSGIENYSRHLSGREPGSRAYTLLDFFPKDFLLVGDESHATIPPPGRPGRAQHHERTAAASDRRYERALSSARRKTRAHPRHHPNDSHRRRSGRLFARCRIAGAVSAQRHRHARTRGKSARTARGR